MKLCASLLGLNFKSTVVVFILLTKRRGLTSSLLSSLKGLGVMFFLRSTVFTWIGCLDILVGLIVWGLLFGTADVFNLLGVSYYE